MNVQQFPMNKFDWNKNTKTLVSELSDLTRGPIGFHIDIVSNRIVRFHLVHREVDSEGDLVSLNYVPDSPCGVEKVVIFND